MVRSSYLKNPARIRERTTKRLAPFGSRFKTKRMEKKRQSIKIDNKREIERFRRLPVRMPITKKINA